MNIGDYIEKLKKKPEREKERVAIIATAISFVVILVIWLISFSETNRSLEENNNSAAQNQFQNLNNNLKEGKQSIQNMLQQVPSQADMAPAVAPQENVPSENINSNSGIQTEPQVPEQNEASQNATQDSQGQFPQLP
jgi:hypothetical protein